MLIKIKILSDTICPWCYIGKKSFDDAKNHFDSRLFQITWIPFQLNPDMPKEGMDRRKYLLRKFGDQKNVGKKWVKLIASAGDAYPGKEGFREDKGQGGQI